MQIILILKIWNRDYRGGGRQSARETATRVAAGAIAKVVLKNKIGKKYQAVGAVTQLGILGCDLKKWKDKTISSNPFFCPDKTVIKLWEKYLLGIRKAGSSCGAIIEVRARGFLGAWSTNMPKLWILRQQHEHML